MNYLATILNQISARITDYEGPVSERYYYDKEADLFYEEYETLRSEIKTLEECDPLKRKDTLQEAWDHKKKHVVNGLGVVCYSEVNSNILMWSHYADSHKGICLEYDSTERPIKKWKNYKYYPVNYDHNRCIDILDCGFENSFFKLITTKSPDWEYEKEYRLITIRGTGYQKSQMGSLKGVILGSRIKENKNELLNKLFLSFLENESKRKNLKKLNYYTSEKDPYSFKIKINKLPGIISVPNALGIC
jgi:hypothetical protein